MRGAQHKLQSQLNKNHSSHVHIFLLWLQSFSSDGQSTLCLLQQEIAVSEAPQPLRFPPAPKLRWFCTSLQRHRGHRNALCCLAVVTPSSASPPHFHRPLLFVLRLAFSLRMDTHLVECSAPKTSVGMWWMERNDSTRPVGTEPGIPAQE